MYLVLKISSYDVVVVLGRIAARHSIKFLKNALSNDSYKCTLFIKYLRTIIVSISHHNMAGAALNGDLARIIELAMVASFGAKGRKKTTFAVKYLRSMIPCVTHHDCVVVVAVTIIYAFATKHSSRRALEECLVVDIVAVIVAHVGGIQNSEKIEREAQEASKLFLLCLVCAKQFVERTTKATME